MLTFLIQKVALMGSLEIFAVAITRGKNSAYVRGSTMIVVPRGSSQVGVSSCCQQLGETVPVARYVHLPLALRLQK